MKRPLNTIRIYVYIWMNEWMNDCVQKHVQHCAIDWRIHLNHFCCCTITIKKSTIMKFEPIWSARLIRFIYCFFLFCSLTHSLSLIPLSHFFVVESVPCVSIVSLTTIFRVRSTIEMQMLVVFFRWNCLFICVFCKMNSGELKRTTRVREKDQIEEKNINYVHLHLLQSEN